MTENTNPFPVSDTAALVMLWAKEYYEDQPLIRTYLERLDLTRGRDLVERYNRICPWYSEVIANRKHFIHHTVWDLIGTGGDRTVIVNVGAGFSPLALELSLLLEEKVRFIELDRDNMDCKRSLYSGLLPDRCGFISCIPSDISDAGSLRETLARELGADRKARGSSRSWKASVTISADPRWSARLRYSRILPRTSPLSSSISSRAGRYATGGISSRTGSSPMYGTIPVSTG